MPSFKLKISWVTILQRVEFSIFLLIFAWALQQCSANTLQSLNPLTVTPHFCCFDCILTTQSPPNTQSRANAATLQRAVATGPLPRHMWWRSRKVAAFARLCVFGGLCVDMWRLVHQWSFFGTWLSFDEWYTVGLPIVKNTQNHWCTNRHRSTKTVPRCTNRQKQSKKLKTVKRQSKQQKWGVTVKGLRDWG